MTRNQRAGLGIPLKVSPITLPATEVILIHISQLRKLRFFLDLVLNDSNIIIILLYILHPSWTGWSLQRTQDTATPTTTMHIYGQARLGSPGHSCQGVFVCVTQKHHSTPQLGIVFQVPLKKKGFFVPQRIKPPFCNPLPSYIHRSPWFLLPSTKDRVLQKEHHYYKISWCRVFSN